MTRLCFFMMTVVIVSLLASSVFGATIYNNLATTNAMGIATRPDVGGVTEIEGADDFFLSARTLITSASIVGLIVPAAGGGTPSITDIVAEMYRIFPADSNAARTPNVPTRANSPSDVALDERDSSVAGQLSFTFSVLNPTFTVLNTVQPGGIHPSPGQTTGGNGALMGTEVQINMTFLTPFNLADSHLFFVPQVALSNGGTFYWLSASRNPISGPGTTPFPVGITDLQTWTRDQALDPDWLRVGMDIVGGTTPPTFNNSFSLDGTVIPEPSAASLVLIALVLIAIGRFAGLRKAM
jgi:hypothetical protein